MFDLTLSDMENDNFFLESFCAVLGYGEHKVHWDGIGWDWTVIIGQRSSEITFGANKHSPGVTSLQLALQPGLLVV